MIKSLDYIRLKLLMSMIHALRLIYHQFNDLAGIRSPEYPGESRIYRYKGLSLAVHQSHFSVSKSVEL